MENGEAVVTVSGKATNGFLCSTSTSVLRQYVRKYSRDFKHVLSQSTRT